jgi:hypothetical protein
MGDLRLSLIKLLWSFFGDVKGRLITYSIKDRF